MDRDALIMAADDKLVAECDMHRYRASGPGGQHRNKTDSAVRFTHRATGLSGAGTESRSQAENKELALWRLREAFAFELRKQRAIAVVTENYAPSENLTRVLLLHPGKKTQKTVEYLLAVAELLDILVACQGGFGKTARAIGIKTGQLTKFVKAAPALARKIGELQANLPRRD